MADLSCINIQPVKGGSEEHNRRLKTLDYVRPDLPHLYWQSDTQAERLATIRDRYTAMTGQRMQAKATPIREGFVRLSERHTMEDLHRLADALHAQFGIKTFQIAMHLDEGHWGELEDGERPQDFEARTIDGVRSYWKPNRHAHLVFDWTDDKTGKSIKLNAKAMSRMQTLVADVLGMERGVSSDKDHLTALQWKNQEQAKANARLMAKAHDLDAAIAAKEQRIDQASGKAKEIGAAAIEGLHNLLQPGKAKQERAEEIAAARADERAKVIQEVQKSAGLTLPDATAESIGQSWGSWYSTAAQRTKDLKAAAIENQGLKAKAEKAEGDAREWQSAWCDMVNERSAALGKVEEQGRELEAWRSGLLGRALDAIARYVKSLVYRLNPMERDDIAQAAAKIGPHGLFLLATAELPTESAKRAEKAISEAIQGENGQKREKINQNNTNQQATTMEQNEKLTKLMQYASEYATGKGLHKGEPWVRGAFNDYFTWHEEQVEAGRAMSFGGQSGSTHNREVMAEKVYLELRDTLDDGEAKRLRDTLRSIAQDPRQSRGLSR